MAPDPQTFSGFTEEWFREYAPRRCTPKTVERYKQLAGYILPYIGGLKLQELTALGLERVFNHLKDAGGRNRKTKKSQPLSAKTVHHIAGLAHVILQKAIKVKLIKTNPMEGVELPRLEPREACALDAEQLTWFLEAARSHGIQDLMTFCAASGCRRGEALALAWTDLDLVNGVARFSKSLEQTKGGLRIKTTKNKRTRAVSLPQSTVAMLQSHKTAQENNSRMFGRDYRTDLDLVFCDPKGEYLKPDSITAKVCLIARKMGLKHVSLHTLRHSHGSQLLSAGVPLPTVSKRLGHSNVYTTATVYSHALPQDDIAAAELWDARFQPASDQTSRGKVS